MDNGIIWLASYPKSGNTWMRILFSNYLSDSDKPVNINELDTDGIASARGRFDLLTGVDSVNLSFEEIDHLRPDIYTHIAQKAERKLIIKVHDAYTYLSDGRALIPNVNSKFVYIVRNPLDVVPSLANHSGKSISRTVEFLCNEKSCFSDNKDSFNSQLRQKLLSWGKHVESFTHNKTLDLLIVRYEDMTSDIHSEFKRVLKFCNFEIDDLKLEKAIKFSDFKQLQTQEEVEGFKERSSKSKRFFFSGKVGNWKEELTQEQIDKVTEFNGKMMKELGYL